LLEDIKNSPLSGVLISAGVSFISVITPSILSGITTTGGGELSDLEQEIKAKNAKKATGNRYIRMDL